MGQEISKIKLTDGAIAEFDQGSFDEWCVYYTPVGGKRVALRDRDYFSWLLDLAGGYGTDRVYGDFIKIYDQTGKTIEKAVLGKILRIAKSYDKDSQFVETAFVILYMTMIAEENRKKTKLGRRIKRLGVHELLINNKSVKTAATFMNGKNAEEIDKLCTARGF